MANHVKLLRRIIGEDINLVVEFAPAALPVQADINMLEQVVMNLVVNARDAMPRGGRLSLSTRQTALDEVAASRAGCPPGPYALLEVRDTGVGIPPAVLARIFEPFFTTKPAGKGTGLGLSTVQAILQQHRGGVLVSSETGRGTEFVVLLPLAQDPAPESGQPAAGCVSNNSGHNATLLVVEDDESVRTIIEHTLRRAGYRTLLARNGAEGLERLASPATIDAVLSDVVMPGGLSGTQLAAEAARRRPGMPVLLMSGFARDLGETDTRILQKPFTMAELLDVVHQTLAGRPGTGNVQRPSGVPGGESRNS